MHEFQQRYARVNIGCHALQHGAEKLDPTLDRVRNRGVFFEVDFLEIKYLENPRLALV